MAPFRELAVIGRRLTEPLTGVGRYFECILRHFRQFEGPFERIRVYAPGPTRLPPSTFQGPLEEVVVPLEVSPLYWENVTLPRHLSEASILFGAYSLPWFEAGRGVVSNLGIYDSRPDDFSLFARLRSTPFFKHSARKSACVLANSASTKDDLVRYYGIEAGRIRVVRMGADEALELSPNQGELWGIEGQIEPIRPYFLMVGKLSKRRNIPLLIEAFARADVPERLVIVGPDYLRLDVPRLAREAGAGDRVDWIEYAPMERLAQLYRAATAYVLPTLHEGFSLTIVEAMACGTPAIVFDHAGLEPEVKAAAAVVEPQELTAALERISRDKVWRGELSSRSLECARMFRWEATARETMAILAETAVRLQRR